MTPKEYIFANYNLVLKSDKQTTSKDEITERYIADLRAIVSKLLKIKLP